MESGNWKDYKIIGYVDLYDLQPGDLFIEDTYPEVYLVARFDGRTLWAKDLTNGGEESFFYAEGYSCYGPCVVKVEPK